MRIIDFLMIYLSTSLTSVYVHSKPVYGYSTLFLPDDIIRLKKRNEDSTTGYLEQCGPVAFPMVQRGVVNVLAFLDSSWPYSHKQAAMLKMLNDRFQRSGLPDVVFFVVNADPLFPYESDDTESDIEKETWLGISADEIGKFSEIERTAGSLELSVAPNIKFIQDNEDLGIWKNLRGSRDQVLVIDRCGKLTYQVIVPWSILHFPYVKAAILSTYKDEPCGNCDIINNPTKKLNKNSTTTMHSVTEVSTVESQFKDDVSTTIDSNIASTTESNFHLEEDMTTANNIPESLVSPTSEYEDKSKQDIDQASSIASFLEFDTTTESTKNPNLITNMENDTVEPIVGNSDELTTLPVTTMISNFGNSLLHAEPTIFETFTTSDTEESFTTFGIEELSNTATSGTTEETLPSEMLTIAQGVEKIFSIDDNYLHEVARNNETNLTDSLDDTVSAMTTEMVTEEALNLDTLGVTEIHEKQEIPISKHQEMEDVSTDKHYLYRDEENNETMSIDISDATESVLMFTVTTEEALNSETLTLAQVYSKEEVSTIQQDGKEEASVNKYNLQRVEGDDAIIPIDILDVTDSILTTEKTTEKTPNLKIAEIYTQQEVPINEHNLQRFATTLKKTNSNIEATIKETSVNEQISYSEDQITTLTTTTEFKNDDTTISSITTSDSTIEYSSTSFETMDTVIETTTKETLSPKTSQNLHIKPDSDVTKDRVSVQNGSMEVAEINRDEESFEMPIRIIMHAPHFHADGDSTRMHEYLVLKTGNYDHHSHLASFDSTRLYNGLQDFREKAGSLSDEDIEAKPWSMTNVIYTKDESPGLYGEVADFWRGTGSQEIYDDAEDTERPEEEITQETGANAGLLQQPSKTNNDDNNPPENKIVTIAPTLSAEDSVTVLETTEMLQADVAHEISTEMNATNIEEFNIEEEETRNKLIAHYSKLLPWLYYVLEK